MIQLPRIVHRKKNHLKHKCLRDIRDILAFCSYLHARPQIKQAGPVMTGMILGWFASLIVDHDFYFLDILVTYKYFIYIKIMGCDLLELLPPTR